MPELHFTKGHGTGNDFVLFADPDGEIELTPQQLQLIADRHFGIGGDGLISAVRSSKLRAGVIWANTYNKFDPTSPFGGYKESGVGREGGLHGLAPYLNLN